jgi:hypothetical protein
MNRHKLNRNRVIDWFISVQRSSEAVIVNRTADDMRQATKYAEASVYDLVHGTVGK